MATIDSRRINTNPLPLDAELELVKDEVRTYAQNLRSLATWTRVFQYVCREQIAGAWISDLPNYVPNGGIPQGSTFRGTFAPSPSGSITTVNIQWEDNLGNPVSRTAQTLFWNPKSKSYDFVFSPPPLQPGARIWTELYFGVDGVTNVLPATIALVLDQDI